MLCTSETARMTSASASRVSEGLEPGSVAMSRSACKCARGRARPTPFRRTHATCRHPSLQPENFLHPEDWALRLFLFLPCGAWQRPRALHGLPQIIGLTTAC